MIKVLTPGEIAELLKIPEQEVNNQIGKGNISAITIGDYKRVTTEALEIFLQNNSTKQGKELAEKDLSTNDVIRILKYNIERNIYIGITDIQNLVYKVAKEEKLLSERDLQPLQHRSKGNQYYRWKHICQAALQRLKNERTTDKFGIYASDHKNKTYKFI